MSVDEKFFSPIKPRRLSQQIEEQIKEAIFSGDIKMGERLPSDRKFAELFGVSRPVVREALRSLETGGLITVRPGAHGGAFLTPITEAPIVGTIDAMVKTGQITHEEILQTRLIIEPPVAAEAARLYTSEFEALLDEAQWALEEGFKSDDIYVEHNPQPNLHKIIAQITRNPLIGILMDVLMNKTVGRQSSIKMDEKSKQRVADGHSEIIQAIKTQNQEAAFRHMKEHVLDVYEIHKELEPPEEEN